MSGDGSLVGNGGSATYKAPSDIPQDKTVEASVVVQDSKTIRLRKGKVITFTNKSYSIKLKLLSSIITLKRNLRRFPTDFMFQLTKEEFEALRFQIETLEKPEFL